MKKGNGEERREVNDSEKAGKRRSQAAFPGACGATRRWGKRAGQGRPPQEKRAPCLHWDARGHLEVAVHRLGVASREDGAERQEERVAVGKGRESMETVLQRADPEKDWGLRSVLLDGRYQSLLDGKNTGVGALAPHPRRSHL